MNPSKKPLNNPPGRNPLACTAAVSSAHGTCSLLAFEQARRFKGTAHYGVVTTCSLALGFEFNCRSWFVWVPPGLLYKWVLQEFVHASKKPTGYQCRLAQTGSIGVQRVPQYCKLPACLNPFWKQLSCLDSRVQGFRGFALRSRECRPSLVWG